MSELVAPFGEAEGVRLVECRRAVEAAFVAHGYGNFLTCTKYGCGHGLRRRRFIGIGRPEILFTSGLGP